MSNAMMSKTAAAALVLAALAADAGGAREYEVTGRWMRLPVANDVRGRGAQVKADGARFRDFEIMFATNEPDWYALLDVSKLMGKKVRLELGGPPFDPAALERVGFTDDDSAPDGYDGVYRPQFHFSARRGWMNDPNGLSWFNGEWHLFFQHNPYGVRMGAMHWAHAVSRDLVHWQELGETLYPGSPYGAIFSGSAVVDKDNTAGFGKNAHILVFTGTAEGGTQNLAWSLDGRSYTLYEGNPVVRSIANGNRDPRVFWYAPGKCWVMLLYVVEDDIREMAILNSPDLKSWTRVGTIKGDSNSKGGGFMHECPELFELPIEGEKGTRWVVFGATGEYGVGTFDGKDFKFEEKYLSMTRNVGGYYAAQSFGETPDGRRIIIPWFQVKMPGMPFNQAQGLPRTLALRRTQDGLRLVQNPVKELEKLRKGKPVKLADFDGELAEIFIDMDIRKTRHVRFDLRGVKLRYDAAREILEVPGGSVYWPLVNGRFKARVFIDRTGMETFSDDGLCVIPSQDAKADPAKRTLAIDEGAENVLDDKSFVYELESIWK